MKIPSYLKALDDLDLKDLIDHQRHIVDDCIELAQKKSATAEDDNAHYCDGLYFAQLRYNELIAELTRRFNSRKS